VKLTIVGCSPAWPNPEGAHSGYLIETGGRRLLLDCGPGVLSRLRQDEWPQVDAIAISHFHLDHFGSLVPWLWGQLFGPGAGSAPPELWLPPGGRAFLTGFATPRQWERAFALSEYTGGETFVAAGHAVTPIRVLHYDEPTWGMRVEDDGSVIAYSADTGPTAALAELARDADLFLCEATLVEPETGQRGHLTADEARSAAEESGSRRLLVTHRAAEHPVDELVHEGLKLEVEPIDG
jgi:ribonuclease BN (tRNA processing enzyme)